MPKPVVTEKFRTVRGFTFLQYRHIVYWDTNPVSYQAEFFYLKYGKAYLAHKRNYRHSDSSFSGAFSCGKSDVWYYPNGNVRKESEFDEDGNKISHYEYYESGPLRSIEHFKFMEDVRFTEKRFGRTFDRHYTNITVHHRTDGPALIRYRLDGSITSQSYFIEGQYYLKSDLKKLIGAKNSEDINFLMKLRFG